MSEKLTYQFSNRPTIKGFPELRWTGKRPFHSTQYFPAQLRERYGVINEGWNNKIFWGDNLQVMSHLLKDYLGKIDLIYIDPPFDSDAEYKKKIIMRGQTITSDNSSFEEKQYGDIWTNDEYLQFMYERLILMRELLSDTGSIFVHCDYRVTSYIRIILDEVFGNQNLKNELIWQGAIGDTSAKNKKFIKSHDTIWFYSKTQSSYWNEVFQAFSDTSEKIYRNHDEHGLYRLAPIDNPGGNGYKYSLGMGEKMPSNGYRMPKSTALEWIEQGILDVRPDRVPGKKIYKNDNGVRCRDVWTDLASIQGNEHQGYPTQKPEALLKRIISATTLPGGIVFDCFMGSGTTQAVAMKLGRRFIGADINLGAVQTTTKRLIALTDELRATTKHSPELIGEEDEDNCIVPQEDMLYTGFEVYNVNNYDFFRNPLEARDLLVDALDIQPFSQSGVWDGELDGRMVKIMPVNRIATKADLEELKANLPYKLYEMRKQEDPTQNVERITLVCMGHEPDLKASLEAELSEYKLDIQIVDILRDKSDLQLKREAEAEVAIEGGQLVIRAFYPLNLMQKLSLQKEFVEDWRQLVESIMIDWNYDGVVMEPTITDVPGKRDMVKGFYDIPDNAGTIKVKITDLLSESLEMEVN
jgi:site-specific DNA-methyltransferase (adenine-specific)/adenine-specific DNA-methyltransferase